MARRRDLLKLLPAAPFALSAAGSSKLPNTVVDPETAPLKKLPFGDAHVYFEGATDQIRSMVGGSLLLAVGKSDPPHKHEEEEFMVIAEGTAEILVDGKTVRVKPGSMMYCGANKTHGITNTGKVPVLFYLLQVEGLTRRRPAGGVQRQQKAPGQGGSRNHPN